MNTTASSISQQPPVPVRANVVIDGTTEAFCDYLFSGIRATGRPTPVAAPPEPSAVAELSSDFWTDRLPTLLAHLGCADPTRWTAAGRYGAPTERAALRYLAALFYTPHTDELALKLLDVVGNGTAAIMAGVLADRTQEIPVATIRAVLDLLLTGADDKTIAAQVGTDRGTVAVIDDFFGTNTARRERHVASLTAHLAAGKSARSWAVEHGVSNSEAGRMAKAIRSTAA